MMLVIMVFFLIGVVVLLVVLFGLVGLFKVFYCKVDQGVVLIVNDMSFMFKVYFIGVLIILVLYCVELMWISLIMLQIDCRGKEGLICCDNMCVDIVVVFYLWVNEIQVDVLCVVKVIGVDCVLDKYVVDELFNVKFFEVLKMVGKKFDFIELFEKCQEFCDEIIVVIGNDLNGYVFEDVVIDYLEQILKLLLDQFNIFDVQGICKIIELIVVQNVVINELEQNEKFVIIKKNVEVCEVLLVLECQQVEVEVWQKCEIEIICVCEEVEIVKVQEEQCQLFENVCIEVQQLIEICDQNCLCEVEVVEQNCQCVVVIEVECVECVCQLEQVIIDCEVQLQGVECDKVVEQGKMDVVNIICECIFIDKIVVQEEECIKEVCEVFEVDCQKQVLILEVEVKVQEVLVCEVKEV